MYLSKDERSGSWFDKLTTSESVLGSYVGYVEGVRDAIAIVITSCLGPGNRRRIAVCDFRGGSDETRGEAGGFHSVESVAHALGRS